MTQVSQFQQWWYNPVTAIVKLWESAGCLSIAIMCTLCFAVQDETNACKNTPNVQNLNVKTSLLCWEWHVSKKLQGWVCNYHLFNWPTQFQANTVLNHLSQIFWEGKKPFTFTLTYIPLPTCLTPPINHVFQREFQLVLHTQLLSIWMASGCLFLPQTMDHPVSFSLLMQEKCRVGM